MMRAMRFKPAVVVALLSLTLAFAFLGLRGIWDPDEGRYTNVSLNMLDSGDWLNPRRNDEVGHWTKPPLTYWAVASSVAVFGRTAWAARLPIALSYLCCVWLAWRLARRLAPGAEALSALVYASMLLPFGAAQIVTTDYPLAALQTLAMFGFVEARFGDPNRARRWLSLMWMAFALAFMTKGPPALLPLLAIVAYQIWVPRCHPHHVLTASGIALFAVLALPWYVAVIRAQPGLLEYFIGAEVIGRIASNEFNRHGEWYGWLEIYVPTLLVGTMPWTPLFWRWLKGLPELIKRWRAQAEREQDAAAVLLVLWVALPMLVFCLSRSRLPMYILPLFVPLAMLIARQRMAEGAGLPATSKVVTWAVLLLTLKIATAYWPTHKNAEAWADAIRERMPKATKEVVFVEDMARYGLNLHLDAEIEKVSLQPTARAQINPEFDGDLATELRDADSRTLFIAKLERMPEISQRIEDIGYSVVRLGAPFNSRALFVVRRHVDPNAAPSPASG